MTEKVSLPLRRGRKAAHAHSQFRRDSARASRMGKSSMRAPVYDVYQMKVRHLPEGVKSAWLRTLPGEKPDRDRWIFFGRERYPSKLTVKQMDAHGISYSETSTWPVMAR
jgi:hypothetical protein